MRLLISGYAGAGNAGDEAILGGLLRTLGALTSATGRPAHAITVISSDPAQTERVHGVAAVPRLAPDTLRAMRRADAVISGGGGLFQDTTSCRPPLYYGGVVQLAGAVGRPYVILSQGLGPLHGGLSRWIAGRALRGAAHVSLRDAGSVDLARALGVRRPIATAPDLALGLEPPPPDPGDRIVVALRGRDLDPARLSHVREAVSALAAAGEVLGLPMHEPADRPVALALVDGMPNGRVTPPTVGYGEVLRTIASARLVVGMRLHALVLAALAGVPAIAVPYDPKVEAFAALVGQPVLRLGSESGPDAVRDAAANALSPGSADGYRRRVEELRAAVGPAVAAALDAIDRARARRA